VRLPRPFVRLPIRVDARALAAELDRIAPDAWRPHPEGAPGNTALPIVAAGGNPADDGLSGPMHPTPHLAQLPYTVRVLASLRSVIGRSRFMRIEEEGELTKHVDSNYYWWEHMRVHVPVATTPDVLFEVGREQINMAMGEVWAVDTWRPHRVVNPANSPRTHLVIDTVGSPWLWRQIEQPGDEPVTVANAGDVSVTTEGTNVPVVMTPWEVDRHLDEIFSEARRSAPAPPLDAVIAAFAPWRRAWRSRWAAHGDTHEGWAAFADLQTRGDALLNEHAHEIRLPNGVLLDEAIRQIVLRPALSPELASRRDGSRAAGSPASGPTVKADVRIERPIFIVSPPRSGSTMLFEALSRARGVFTIGGESHRVIEGIPALHPKAHGWDSNRLGAEEATPDVVEALRASFTAQLRDRDERRPLSGAVRLLEKTPKNALRIPFLAAAFPDATFVSLYRDPRETLSSMIEAWRSRMFVTYRDLPEWRGDLAWSMLLVPGWRDLAERPLAEVVAEQWAVTTATLLDDLDALDPDRWCVASYSRLVAEPDAELRRISEFCGIDWDVDLDGPLPIARHTLDTPAPEKWRKNAELLNRVWDRVDPVAARAREIFGSPPRARVAPVPASADAQPVVLEPDDRPPATGRRITSEQAFRSVHSGPFAGALTEFGCTVVASTYQSGRVIFLRSDGDSLNTHFRVLREPMGIAMRHNLLAIGTRTDIHVFQNQPAVTARLPNPEKHDACFMPRHSHTTGDLRVHDLAYADEELWLVNTRFSCLATLDAPHSFVPRWRPKFVSTLAPEDRCHLNGLAVVDGAPRYVTALGVSDEPGGWREHKVDGGVLIDVASDEIVASGLCMPHSPRWHRDRLWVLESGRGTLGVVDLESGTVEDVATLPGFTRGLSFYGGYAFVGLSQVREHLFDGLPLTADGVERNCGVWIVDLSTGRTVAFVRFEGLVQELFEVAVLRGVRFPELVEPGATLVDSAYVLPDEALAEVPVRGPEPNDGKS
jgi:uncharacterized protein (TIGR03032 family)